MYLINKFEHVNEYSGGILAVVFYGVEFRTLVVLLQAEARGQCLIDYDSGCLIDFNS